MVLKINDDFIDTTWFKKRTKWRGDPDVLIDRFDARAHLDYFEEYRGDEAADEELETRFSR
jgi:hypothetical protein